MKTKALAAALLGAFALAGCVETTNNLRRKPGLVDRIAADSLQKCDTTEPAHRDSNYETRLRAVLDDTNARALDVYLRDKITICLDHRIAGQNENDTVNRIYGVYNRAAGTPVVSIWDNGMAGSGRRLFQTDTPDYGPEMLERFASAFTGGSWFQSPLGKDVVTAIAGQYTCGNTCVYLRWDPEADFDKDSIRRNPALLTPPLLARP